MKQSRQENLIYLVMWVLLFAAPLLSLYIRTANDPELMFEWTEVFIVWRKFLVFLLLFLVHNFFLAPLLVHEHRRVLYASIVVAVIAAFTVYQCSISPDGRREPLHHKPSIERPERPDFMEGGPERPQRPPSLWGTGPEKRPYRKLPHNAPPPFIGEHDILAVVLLILMFGANVGIKGYYRSRNDRRRLAELERENLEQQLEYLRYQINPHFFMNTLNNIHALVDIDPEKAKDTIVELSKMMRYLLYEGNKQRVPLSNELDFIRHYVALMQLRYTDKVRIVLDLPTEYPDRQIPPLLLITFIENAFKHGVSYQHESFIQARVEIQDEELRFTCRNSKPRKSNNEERQRGLGLANIHKRLDLLYDHTYTLQINDAADLYSVELNIPLKL